MNKAFAALAAALLCPLAATAQIMPWENRTDPDAYAAGDTARAHASLDLERVVAGTVINTRGAGAVNWLKDGKRYTRLERNDSLHGQDLVAYTAADNRREVLVAADRFRNPATGKPVPVRSVTWSPDNRRLLVFTNTRKVWRYHTRGDYWVLDLDSGTFRQLGKDLPEASLMFAKFSPDGDRVAYVSGNDIYTENLNDGTVTRLTHDGSDRIVNGTFDWVYEEEFGCRDGFRWSPSGQYIAYWQSDTDGTGWFDIINNVDSIYPSIQRFPYPKAGTANSAVKVGWVPAAGGETTWIGIPGDSRNNYIPRMEFLPGEDVLMIQQLNRPQNTNRVWLTTLGGEPDNIFTDTDAAWLDTNDDVQWLDGNKWFTWLSERDGWRHLYRVSRDGSRILPVTSGEFDYISPAGTDAKRGLAYFIASPDNATQRYLYSARLMGDGKCTRVTPDGYPGQHRYSVSPTGQWAVHTYSNAATPPVIDMVSLPDHRRRRVVEDNAEAREQYAALGLNPKEFFKVPSGDLMLDGWMIRPADFDPSLKYPVIVEVYGEPASSTVQDVWNGGDLWPQYMANRGYVVVSFDNRGAAAPRGRQWRKCVYGEVGTLASEDQANAVRSLAARYPFIDPERVGINGWSGGGSQTLNCMFRYPEVFSTGIAIAFVADQKTYDTIYQERYMDTPQNNPEGYAKGSPISYASGLKGDLLLIHGTGDDNVHYQNCEMLVNELIRHGKLFWQVSYPMRTHAINEGSGTSLHLRRTMERFWLDHLAAGPK